MTAFATLPLDGNTVSKRTFFSPQSSMRDFARRTMHGGTGWIAGVLHKSDYQPQDQVGCSELADGMEQLSAVRELVVAGEPMDAGMTGATRSLKRRLSGLNVRPERTRFHTVLPRAA